ncbi:MAG: hypothetical protein JRE38_01165, partial [Deltaproteobacteria bacterium]|nr:hypothetical protein [Deltaproteobacteria bacterium]
DGNTDRAAAHADSDLLAHADGNTDRNANSTAAHADSHDNLDTLVNTDNDGITDGDTAHERQN